MIGAAMAAMRGGAGHARPLQSSRQPAANPSNCGLTLTCDSSSIKFSLATGRSPRAR